MNTTLPGVQEDHPQNLLVIALHQFCCQNSNKFLFSILLQEQKNRLA